MSGEGDIRGADRDEGESPNDRLVYDNVWQCRYVVKDGATWKCMAPGCSIYNQPRKGHNAFKVMHHYNGTPKMGIAPCTGDVASNVKQAMRDLLTMKLRKKEARIQGENQFKSELDDMQANFLSDYSGKMVVDSATTTGTMSSPGSIQRATSKANSGSGLIFSARKRPPPDEPVDLTTSKSQKSSHSKTAASFGLNRARGRGLKQMTLTGNTIDPDAPAKMDVAFAHAIHSHLLPENLGECPLWQKVIEIARTLPPNYELPARFKVGGKLLDTIHHGSYNKAVQSLLKEARTFGVVVYGDAATVGKFPLFNFLGAGVNNPYALLAIIDQSDQAATGKKKDASYVAQLALPIIAKLEAQEDHLNRKHAGIVDMLAFDGAKQVQNAGDIIAQHYPRITVVHGAEHAVSLFFKDVFEKVDVFKIIAKLNRKFRNVFGSIRHAPSAMFREESKKHFRGRAVGFVKPSDVRYVGSCVHLDTMICAVT